MRALFRLFVILMLALTSQGLASARGPSRAVAELVICAGATVTTLTVDADGKPVTHHDFCPDMAPQLLAAIAPDGLLAVRSGAVARAFLPARPGLAMGRDAPGAQARDPPPGLG